MKLRQLYEAPARKVVAVMPGGFHPFHPGHKSLYDWAVKQFGQTNVYVAATNDTSTRPFPFDVKKQLASFAGVPPTNFIQVKSPFNLNSYGGLLQDGTALVFVRSEKDRNEQPQPDRTKKDGTPGYLKSYKDDNMDDHTESGYMTYGPTKDFQFSGGDIKSASELRNAWPSMTPEDKRKAAEQMYPGKGEEASKLLDTALGTELKATTTSPEVNDAAKSVSAGWAGGSSFATKEDEDVNELNLFKRSDNASVKEQDPNKLKVLDWIADRADGKEHFLSFYRKGAAWSGRLLFIKPDAAKKFRQKVEDNPDHLDRIKKALTNIETSSKLFTNLGIKHHVRRAE